MKVIILVETSTSSRVWNTAIPLLLNKGIEVHVATIRVRGNLHEELEKKGITTYALNAGKSKDYLKTSLKLAKLIHREKFDVVHANETIPASIAGLACKIVGIKTCIYHRQSAVVEGSKGLAILDKMAFRFCNLLMAVSGAVAQAAQNKISKEKIRVAYNGVEPLRTASNEELSDLRRSLQIPREAKIITIVARLRKIKGHDVLFDAVKIVKSQSTHDIHVVVVGEGEDEMNLRNKATFVEKVKFHFVGHQSDVAPWFKVADVVAMPSYSEGMPFSAAEAVSLGKVLVASDVGGLPEIIENGKSGFLVPPGNVQLLAEALTQVLNSPELADIMGKNAKERFLENFTAEKMVDSWIECYKQVLN
jgi:glycosyltransferase involved in cell wall biosynthesis